MARLPQPGGDTGTWGDILNDFLSVAHNNDGSLKNTGVLAGKYVKPVSGIPKSDLSSEVQDVLNNAQSGSVPDADSDTKGKLRLAGDLTGSANAPNVAAGAIDNSKVAANAEIAQSKIAGLETALGSKLDSSAIGDTVQAHSSVLDNTTASFTTAQETKLSGIETGADVTNATNVAAAGAVMVNDTDASELGFVIDEDDMSSNSSTKVPTQQSVKAYVDANAGGDQTESVPYLKLEDFSQSMTHADIVSTGMAHWPDGSIGFIDGGGGARIGFAANADRIATTAHDSSTGAAVSVIDTGAEVQGIIDDELDYYAGGPVFAPNAYGLSNDLGLLLMLHGEKHADGHHWTGIGMAKIDLNDQKWYDLGLVITPEAEFTGALTTNTDSGSGNFAFDDQWYYVFFKDRSNDSDLTQLSVARAPLEDVIEAATNNGPVPEFTKYSGGSWSSAGVGGARADDILSHVPGYVIWWDVVWVESYGGWALVYTRDTQTSETVVDTVQVVWSKDLINWSEPQTLVAPNAENERFYVTVTSPLDNEPFMPKVIKEDDMLDVYIVRSDLSETAAERWDTADVERYRYSVKTRLELIEGKQDVLSEGPFVDGDKDKLDSVAAGAVMKSDTSTANMDFVIDEDDMSSDSDTKVPTQQSVKAYVDGLPGLQATEPTEVAISLGDGGSTVNIGLSSEIARSADYLRKDATSLSGVSWVETNPLNTPSNDKVPTFAAISSLFNAVLELYAHVKYIPDMWYQPAYGAFLSTPHSMPPGDLLAYPVYLRSGTLSNIGIEVQTTGGGEGSTVKFGIYPSSSSGAPSSSLLASSAVTFDTSTTGVKEAGTYSVDIPLHGIYWFAYVAQGGSAPSLRGLQNEASIVPFPRGSANIGSSTITRARLLGNAGAYASGDIPSTPPSLNTTRAEGPLIYFKYSA